MKINEVLHLRIRNSPKSAALSQQHKRNGRNHGNGWTVRRRISESTQLPMQPVSFRVQNGRTSKWRVTHMQTYILTTNKWTYMTHAHICMYVCMYVVGGPIAVLCAGGCAIFFCIWLRIEALSVAPSLPPSLLTRCWIVDFEAIDFNCIKLDYKIYKIQD